MSNGRKPKDALISAIRRPDLDKPVKACSDERDLVVRDIRYQDDSRPLQYQPPKHPADHWLQRVGRELTMHSLQGQLLIAAPSLLDPNLRGRSYSSPCTAKMARSD